MKYFPFFIDIENKSGLIVGGGEVAAEKVFRLQPFHSNITVIAPAILDKLLHNKHIQCIERKFKDDDIYNKFYVIAATNDRQLNKHISDLCKKQGILVNVVDDIGNLSAPLAPKVVDDMKQCGFIFPSLVTSGSMCIGISTGGASPSIASIYREKIQKEIPENMEEILLYLAECRKCAKENIHNDNERKHYLKEQAKRLLDMY